MPSGTKARKIRRNSVESTGCRRLVCMPNEDEQYEVYRSMVNVLAGRPLLVRTLDQGL